MRRPPREAGYAAANLELVHEAQQTAAINQQVARSLDENDVPANLEPSLPDAEADEPPVFVDGCLDSYTDASLQPCVFGDASSPRRSCCSATRTPPCGSRPWTRRPTDSAGA